MPLYVFKLALQNSDIGKISFCWNMVAFANTIFLNLVVQKDTFPPIFKLLMNPHYPPKKYKKHPSAVIEDCPTRQLTLREDIYEFSYALCLKDEILRDNFKIPTQDIPSAN